jgi:hypothetical protein
MGEQRPISILIAAIGDIEVPNALGSALGQTVKPAEVIIAINPSLYKGEVKDAISSKGSAVRCCVPDRDVGAGALLRAAADAATQPYIAWMRANHVLDPRKIELQLAALDKAPAGRSWIVSTGIRPVSSRDAAAGDRISNPRFVAEADEDAVSVLASLLDGSRDPATILAPRSCVDAISGFDTSYALVPELDLATRLAAQFPFAHVPATLVRRRDSRTAAQSAEVREDNERVRARVLAEQRYSLIDVGRLTRALGRDATSFMPVLRRRVSDLVDERTLTVVVFRSGKADAEFHDFKQRLGIPAAQFVVIDDHWTRISHSRLIEAARRSGSEWVIAVDAGAIPHAETVAMQLLQATAAGFDSCLPMADTIVYEPVQIPSLILGTLFRRSTLAHTRCDPNAAECEFWHAFSTYGRVGALPAVQDIARPAAKRMTPESTLTIPDLVFACIDQQWYLRTHPDVAKAKVDPVQHYLEHGWRERRDPSPWFSSHGYLRRHPDLETRGVCPLVHFLENDGVGDIWSYPGFDLRWTVRRHLGAEPVSFESLLQFFFPGLPAIADRAGLDRATAWREVEVAAPALLRMIRSLADQELAIYEQVIRLVDPEWYLETYKDVASAKVDPIDHYLTYGWRERRDPNPWFATGWYIEQNPEAGEPHGSAVEHFIRTGAREGKPPHPSFHLRWYAGRYLPGGPLNSEVLSHFLHTGAGEGAVPDPRLDREDIRRQLLALPPPRRKARIRELQARLGGERETLRGLVDQDWYRATYPDVSAANVDPVDHYVMYGWRERRDPSAWFHTAWYMAQNADVAASGICPLVHYARYGAAEDRRPCSGFDTGWYARHYLNADSPSTDALAHFLTTGLREGAVPAAALYRADVLRQVAECPVAERSALLHRLERVVKAEEEIVTALVDEDWYHHADRPSAARHYREKGWREGRNPNPWFDTQWYLEQNPDVRNEDICPLDHFVRIGAAEGRRPHPMFDIESYARRYLSGSKPIAEALLHFMTIGLDKGAAPDPRLATPAMRKRLLDVPASDRPAFMNKLLAVLSRTPLHGQRWNDDEASLWPALLTRNFPENTVAALLLCPNSNAARDQARAAAMALPVEETALFGFLDSDSDLCLSDSAGEDGLSVTLTLPKELNALQALLTALPCRRAAAIDPSLLHTGIVRAVRNAGVPVFTNGAAR